VKPTYPSPEIPDSIEEIGKGRNFESSSGNDAKVVKLLVQTGKFPKNNDLIQVLADPFLRWIRLTRLLPTR